MNHRLRDAYKGSPTPVTAPPLPSSSLGYTGSALPPESTSLSSTTMEARA